MVTVFAADAATADVVATLIANAVDVNTHKVTRCAAWDLQPGSDLGRRLVTASVGTLTQNECDEALCAGINVAEQFVRSGAIVAAILCLQGQVRSVGEFELSALAGDNSFLCPDGQSLTPPC